MSSANASYLFIQRVSGLLPRSTKYDAFFDFIHFRYPVLKHVSYNREVCKCISVIYAYS